jgi:outer membrane biosynthesis protein TonB
MARQQDRRHAAKGVAAATITAASLLGMSTAASAAVPVLGDSLLGGVPVVGPLTSDVIGVAAVPDLTIQTPLIPLDILSRPAPEVVPAPRDEAPEKPKGKKPKEPEVLPTEQPAPPAPVVEQPAAPAAAPAPVLAPEPAPVRKNVQAPAPAPKPVVRQAPTFGGTSVPVAEAETVGAPAAEVVRRARVTEVREPSYAVPAAAQQSESALPTVVLAGLGVALVALYNLTSRLRWVLADRRDQRSTRDRR